MHDIRHFNSTVNGFEMMLMMPHLVRPVSLLIYKVTLILHMRNFRHPVHWYPHQWPNAVFNDLSGVHHFTMVSRKYPEP